MNIKKMVTIPLPEHFNYMNCSEVELLWEQVLLKRPQVVMIDFNSIVSIDSTALGTVIKFYIRGNADNIELHFLNTSRELTKIFEITKINKFITITPKDSSS